MARRGRDRLQRADLGGDEVLDLGRLQAGHRSAAESVQIAIAWMSPNADATRLRKLNRPPHEIGVASVKTAGDVDGGGKLDHGGVVAHLPGPKSFAKVAVEIDGRHVVSPCVTGSLVSLVSTHR